MENMKIYRNGQYDTKANIILKVRCKLPAIIDAIDGFFVNH